MTEGLKSLVHAVKKAVGFRTYDLDYVQLHGVKPGKARMRFSNGGNVVVRHTNVDSAHDAAHKADAVIAQVDAGAAA